MRPSRTRTAPSILLLGPLVAAGAVGLPLIAPPGSAGAATSAAASGGTGAPSEYRTAIKAVDTQGVHFTSVASEGGVTIHVVGDAGAASGQQQLVVSNGSVTERVSEEVVGKTAYINGNRAALQRVIGLTSAESAKYAGAWLSFPASTQGLDQLVSGLLGAQVASELEMSGPYTFGTPTTMNGQRVLAIRGQQSTASGGKVTTVLYVPASGKPLPIEEVTNPNGDGGRSAVRGTVTFSDWGETTSVARPAHARSLLAVAHVSASSSSS